MDQIVFSVAEFNEAINRHLHLIPEVAVEGEISQLSLSQGRWLFLTIKDASACLSVFAVAQQISGFRALEEGMKVIVYGVPGIHQRSGKFSLQANRILPSGEGALQLAYEKLKRQLQAEGLFSPERKRTIVRFPERIGLITAKDARAYSDFIKVMSERWSGVEIHFYPVQVQGNNSVKTLLNALSYFNKSELEFDALVMVRGGGSLEDLISFNDEQVARAVFASKYPVITGVGHEDDVSLVDLVADVRASTPSNAAELLFPTKQQIGLEINHLTLKIEQAIGALIEEKKSLINQKMQRLDGFFLKFQVKFQQIQNNFVSLIDKQSRKISLMSQQITQYEQRLILNADFTVTTFLNKVDSFERLLQSFDHRQILKRGFAINRDDSGKIISKIGQIKPSLKIHTTLIDGIFSSQVLSISQSKN
ncbi:MAG: exodeoxyribonuclease VII large subunit [Patescibacteria group bacterium]